MNQKITSLKAPIENQLKNFVKIMKFSDLNLWSVKISAQKAHGQLFRMIKKFKVSLEVIGDGCFWYVCFSYKTIGEAEENVARYDFCMFQSCSNDSVASVLDGYLFLPKSSDIIQPEPEWEDDGCSDHYSRKTNELSKKTIQRAGEVVHLSTLLEVCL